MDDPVQAKQRSKLRRDLVPAVLGYVVVLALATSLVGDDVDRPGEWALLLLPVVPAWWGVRAGVRHLRRLDEYQRLLQLEALAAGFGAAVVVAVTLGLLALGGAALPATAWLVAGSGTAAWAVTALVQSHRG